MQSGRLLIRIHLQSNLYVNLSDAFAVLCPDSRGVPFAFSNGNMGKLLNCNTPPIRRITVLCKRLAVVSAKLIEKRECNALSQSKKVRTHFAHVTIIHPNYLVLCNDGLPNHFVDRRHSRLIYDGSRSSQFT